MKGNCYEALTRIEMTGQFYNVAQNVLADPTSVSLFIEDPSGDVTEITNTTRVSVGVYTYLFVPTAPGQWKYKFQGYGTVNSPVIATSPDVWFFVKTSAFESNLEPIQS